MRPALLRTVPGVQLDARDGLLWVIDPDFGADPLPVTAGDTLRLHFSAGLSPAAWELLLARGVEVVFLTQDGRFRARLEVVGHPRQAAREAVARLVVDPARRLRLATGLVRSKLRNQRHNLLRRRRVPRPAPVQAALDQIDLLLRREVSTLEELRGVEGLGARAAFDAMGSLLEAPGITWTGRNRRPPTDPVNAALSFAYSGLLREVVEAVDIVGLDVGLGVLHEAGSRPALALDLMEELRPEVDRLVVTLFNRRQLRPEDFRHPLPGELEEDLLGERAVWLGEVARQTTREGLQGLLQGLYPCPRTGQPRTLRQLIQGQVEQVAEIALGQQGEWQPLFLP